MCQVIVNFLKIIFALVRGSSWHKMCLFNLSILKSVRGPPLTMKNTDWANSSGQIAISLLRSITTQSKLHNMKTVQVFTKWYKNWLAANHCNYIIKEIRIFKIKYPKFIRNKIRFRTRCKWCWWRANSL